MKIIDAQSLIDTLDEMDAKQYKLPVYYDYKYNEQTGTLDIAVGTSEKYVSAALQNPNMAKLGYRFDEDLELFTPSCCVFNDISTIEDFFKVLKVYELCKEFLALGGLADINRPVNLPQMEMFHRGVHKFRPLEFQTETAGYSQDISMQNHVIDGVRISDIVTTTPPDGYSSVRMSAPELMHFIKEFGLQMFDRDTIEELKLHYIPETSHLTYYMANKAVIDEYNKHATTKYKDYVFDGTYLYKVPYDASKGAVFNTISPPKDPRSQTLRDKDEKTIGDIWWKVFNKMNELYAVNDENFRADYRDIIIEFAAVGYSKLKYDDMVSSTQTQDQNVSQEESSKNLSSIGILQKLLPAKRQNENKPRKIIGDSVFVNRGVYESFYTFSVPNELKIFIKLAKTISRGDNVFKGITISMGEPQPSFKFRITLDIEKPVCVEECSVVLTPKELELIIAYSTNNFRNKMLLENISIHVIDDEHIRIVFNDKMRKEAFLREYDRSLENIQKLNSAVVVYAIGDDHVYKTSTQMKKEFDDDINNILNGEF